jgi:hypothetical protein
MRLNIFLFLFIFAITTTARGAEEHVVRVEGRTFKIRAGAAHEVKDGEETFFAQLYDPGHVARAYSRVNGKIYRRADDGKDYPTYDFFKEGFEGAGSIQELIGPKRGWGTFTLQSPETPTVQSYVKLRQEILLGKKTFIDNRVEPSTRIAHGGQTSLRCLSQPPNRNMQTAKASLENPLLHFVRDDHFWFSGWYYIEKGFPGGLVDLESTYVDSAPGPRVLLDENRVPRVELKWGDKPTYRPTRPAALPLKKWFRLTVHFRLHETDGGVRVWVDGTKIIDQTGPTLPLPDLVLDSLEIGLPATHPGGETELFVDDVVVSRTPLTP